MEERLARRVDLLADTVKQLAASQPKPRCIIAANEDAVAEARVGGRDVTTTDGLLLRAGAAVTLDRYRGPLYAISANAIKISVLEVVQD